ncbi:DUF4012 domain-containing protein [bacterium]|jgi:hypothetical protein|nr:DUF4012 domain-containing protein [bacterium]MBT4648698.1 DUF4012 domain-containing protein [bacterium]
MVAKKKIKQKSKADFKELKHSLVDELDDFLFDNNLPIKEKNAAFTELDRLIKQDLTEATLLIDSYKKVNKLTEAKSIKSKIRTSKVKQLDADQVNQSGNVLDLRQQKPLKKPRKKLFSSTWNKKIKIHLAKTKFKKVKISEKKITLPKFNLGIKHLGLRLAMFAVLVAVILLPIRGLMVFGQFQADKGVIFELGKSGLANLQSGILSASENSHTQADADFEQALQNFNAIKGILNEYESWMLTAGSKLPLIGTPISLSTNLLEIANNISQAAVSLNKKLQNNESVTEHIAFIDKQIELTLPYLQTAAKDLGRINTAKLPEELQEYFIVLQANLPQLTDSLGNLQEVFDVLLEVLGHDQEKRYLVLFQNNNEIRATGGFIGSFALLDIYQGKIKHLEVPKGGMYDLEAGQTVKIKAPQALSLINPYFNIWDANWWPDFPTSAKKINWFYQNFGGSAIDGIIAINADVLQDLLQVVGPIDLPDYNLVVSADNFFEVIQEEVEFNYDKESNTPKAIIADLTPLVLEKLLTSKDKQKDLVKVLVNQLASKDIQIYLNDSKIQAKVHQFAWSGAALDSQKDYLQVVNTNIAGGKTDNDIQQNIDHQAEILANGEIINTVRITRTNNGRSDNPLSGFEGGNVSYLRFYVPNGSEFIEAVGFDQLPEGYFHSVDAGTMEDEDILAEEEKMIDANSNTEIYQSLNKTVFANWLALKPGETKTVAIKYKLPFTLDVSDPLINNWWQKLFKGDIQLDNYSLLVQSQSGSKNTILNSSILLPDNLRVVWNKAISDQQMSVNNKVVTYTNKLIGDQYFGFIVTTK